LLVVRPNPITSPFLTAHSYPFLSIDPYFWVMIKTLSKSLAALSFGLLVMGCSSTAVITAPPISLPNVFTRVSELSEPELKRWSHLDPIADTVPGMSVDRAYAELLKKRKGKTVIVGVIDSGIDLGHEDIKDVLWVNKGEVPGDGKDNDGNGYIDDVHGYNFLGESNHEQKESARIVRLKIGDEAYQAAAKAKLESEIPEARESLPQLQQVEQFVRLADQSMQEALGKKIYTLADLKNFQPKTPQQEQFVGVLLQVMQMDGDIPAVLENLADGITYYQGQLDYHLNVDFDGRKPVGD